MTAIWGHDKSFEKPVIWITTLFMLLFHMGAVAALFMFSWSALAVAILLWWIACSLGIGMGYHRLLTHRGYRTHKWIEYGLTLCGTLGAGRRPHLLGSYPPTASPEYR